jgi:hypothetical protein
MKISFREFSDRLVELLLLREGDVEWAKEPKVRRAWHLLFFGAVIALGIQFVLNLVLSEEVIGVSGRAMVTVPYRVYKILVTIVLLFFLTKLMQNYYATLLLTGKDLRFRGIIFFYLITILFFGDIYRGTYYLEHTLFSYPNPVLPAHETIQTLGLNRFVIGADFTVYSACTMVFLPYPRIISGSAVVSLINIGHICTKNKRIQA